MAFSTSIYISALLAASAVMALPQIPPASSSTASSLPSASPKPVPTQDGIAANCDSFYWVDIGDSCWAITQSKGISLTDFYGWNPAVGTDCKLIAGTYVCVHAPTKVAPSPSPSPSPPPPPATSTGPGIPTPTQPGVVPNCRKFHFVSSGENCWIIGQAEGITFDQFRAWNTQIDAGCSNLWGNAYVCVGV